MDGFYDGVGSLFVDAYDAFYGTELPQFAGDIGFYTKLAQEAEGDTVELACGTARITLVLARAGIAVTGVDVSEGMLADARRKSAALPEDARRRLTLRQQDMVELDLDRRFAFAFVPFRSFQHLLTVEQQMQALRAIHRHLRPNGRLALHLFDPRLDLLIDPAGPVAGHEGVDARSGHRFKGEVIATRFDHLAQTRHDRWRYTETTAQGVTLREETREMVLRWTYRFELHHLLARSGFEVEAEFSDFDRTPPAYGKELIIVAHATPRS